MNEFPKFVEVTSQRIDLRDLIDTQKEYFYSLRDDLIKIYSLAKKERAIVSLSGISGTGKSVAAAILFELMKNVENEFTFYTCGLDAFHFNNEHLEKHNLKGYKGRYDTYDTNTLLEKLKQFNDGKNVVFPVYSREIHEPIEEGFLVSEKKALLLIEGLWFLRDNETWQEIRDEIHYSMYIEGGNMDTKSNVLERHVRGGRSEKDAEDFYATSDRLNSKEIVSQSVKPDKVIPSYANLVK